MQQTLQFTLTEDQEELYYDTEKIQEEGLEYADRWFQKKKCGAVDYSKYIHLFWAQLLLWIVVESKTNMGEI